MRNYFLSSTNNSGRTKASQPIHIVAKLKKKKTRSIDCR